MRKLFICCISALALIAVPAYADRGYGRGGHRGDSHHHGGGSVWAGVAVVGALTGLALMASRPVYADPYPAQAVITPPIPARGAQNWYYCASSAMYYPYTQACPEGWQAVPASPY